MLHFQLLFERVQIGETAVGRLALRFSLRLLFLPADGAHDRFRLRLGELARRRYLKIIIFSLKIQTFVQFFNLQISIKRTMWAWACRFVSRRRRLLKIFN